MTYLLKNIIMKNKRKQKQIYFPYEFYKYPESKREEMVGQEFSDDRNYYFILKLKDSCFNYNSKQGIIFVPKERMKTLDKTYWTCARVISPDDLDIDLDINPATVEEHKIILNAVRQENKINVDYKEFLESIHSKIGIGEISP